MQQTRDQYNSAGWPLPGPQILVDSPLAALLLLIKVWIRVENGSNWQRAWEVLYDSFSLDIRRRAPGVPTPGVAAPGLQRLPRIFPWSTRDDFSVDWLGRLRWSNTRTEDVISAVINEQLTNELRGGNSITRGVTSNESSLWDTMRLRLRPTFMRTGVVSWAFVGLAIETRPPETFFDDRNRLHREDGPAVIYPDGWSSYLWHGILVPRNVIENPSSITVTQIDNEANIESRRVMIEKMGAIEYIQRSGAVEIHRDRFGILYRKELPGDEPVVMVKVINSTPEPDGSRRDYWIRVSPEIRTAKAAVAWSFGLTESEYDPIIET